MAGLLREVLQGGESSFVPEVKPAEDFSPSAGRGRRSADGGVRSPVGGRDGPLDKAATAKARRS